MSLPAFDRPARMVRNGRPVDPHFDPQENLYFRIPPGIDEDEGGRVPTTSIRYPDMSVNREKYSEPEDVIFGFPGFGIAAFRVRDVPAEMKSEGGGRFEYKVEHVPEDLNYSHSEVRTYKNGVHTRKIKIPEQLKKVYRTILMERTRLLRPPEKV